MHSPAWDGFGGGEAQYNMFLCCLFEITERTYLPRSLWLWACLRRKHASSSKLRGSLWKGSRAAASFSCPLSFASCASIIYSKNKIKLKVSCLSLSGPLKVFGVKLVSCR